MMSFVDARPRVEAGLPSGAEAGVKRSKARVRL